MHELNNDEKMHSFYEPANHKKLEVIYNRLFGTIPITITFADAFDVTALKIIEENFDMFTQDITVVGGKFIEETVWVNKPKNTNSGEITQTTFLHTSYRSSGGGRVFFEHMSDHDDIKKELDALHVHVKAACKNREDAKGLYEILIPHKLEHKNKIYMLASTYGDLVFTPLSTEKVSSDLTLNYGEDFPKFHDNLISSLKNKKSGLYLFNGPPGTGKSSYIKYLTSCDLDRKIVYIPGGLIEKLVSPDMVPLLLENKNVVLVIEDAEKALKSRELSTDTDIVQTILNLTSGFLGDAANVSVIATFNTDKENIDEALLRKGRLKLSWEFKKLSLPATIALAKSLNFNTDNITEGMTLADIYHMDELPGYTKQEEKRVGFF